MNQETMIVIVGILFFLIAGAFAALGFYQAIKNRRKLAFALFAIGFLCIVIFIVSYFMLL